MSKAAMKLALDALEGCYGRTKRYGVNRARAIVSLSQALAEPEQPARVPLTDAQIKSIAYDYGALPEVITDASLLAYSRALLEIAKSTNTSGCFGPYDPEDDQK